MRNRITFGPGFAVFVIFFGIALLDAFRSQNLLRVGFWLVIAIAFLFGDNVRKSPANHLNS